jgi:hypothetical protein
MSMHICVNLAELGHPVSTGIARTFPMPCPRRISDDWCLYGISVLQVGQTRIAAAQAIGCKTSQPMVLWCGRPPVVARNCFPGSIEEPLQVIDLEASPSSSQRTGPLHRFGQLAPDGGVPVPG